MKRTSIKFLASYIVPVFIAAVALTSCSDDDDPKKEDTPELITKVTLTFTPKAGGTAITATATDPDGQGQQDIAFDGPVNLARNTEYVLAISLINGLAAPTDDEYNISAEVEDEGDEHQFFFAWTKNAFSNPAGNGNVDNASDPLRYEGAANAKDENGHNLGLTTTWTTTDVAVSAATFNVILKHQPDLKTATSTSAMGETDLDVTFPLNIN
jgi:hypothetical protein